VKITQVDLFALVDASIASIGSISLIDASGASTPITIGADSNFSPLLRGSHIYTNKNVGTWKVKNEAGNPLDETKINDLYLVFYYQLQ
jgi:hypothetical protein